MDHKYVTLMEETDARWIIRPMPTDDADLSKMLDDLKAPQMIHYFMLGSMTNINKVMELVSN